MNWITVLLLYLGTSLAGTVHPQLLEKRTLDAGNLAQNLVQESEIDCSIKPRSTVDPLDCDEAIHDYKRRFPEVEHTWHWTHDPAATWEHPILAPNTTTHNTCRFTVDFFGHETSPGATASTVMMGHIGFDVIDECIIKQGREGGRGYAFEGDVFYFMDVGDIDIEMLNARKPSMSEQIPVSEQ